MHCMAWHIILFLKSLRSLEEFRKNSHAKIPSKSPCTNFQNCQKNSNFKKKSKRFITCIGPSFGFQPSRGPPPFSFPNWPLPPPSPLALGHLAARSAQLATRWWRPARLPPPSRGDASNRTALAPLCALLIGGPHLSLTSGSARARSCRHHLPPLFALPSSTPRDAALSRYSPHHHSPLNSPLLTSPPSSMALKPLMLPLPPRPPLPGAPLAPIKG
jgi:hypothetical protein